MRPLAVVEEHERDLGGGWLGGGQPSEARLRQVVEGRARVITLRAPTEDPGYDEAAVVAAAGERLRVLPTSASSFRDVAFRKALYDLLDRERAQLGPVYLHCGSGNRVGAAWALYQAERLGVAPGKALELGKAAGLSSLEPEVRRLLGLPPIELVKARPSKSRPKRAPTRRQPR